MTVSQGFFSGTNPVKPLIYIVFRQFSKEGAWASGGVPVTVHTPDIISGIFHLVKHPKALCINDSKGYAHTLPVRIIPKYYPYTHGTLAMKTNPQNIALPFWGAGEEIVCKGYLQLSYSLS